MFFFPPPFVHPVPAWPVPDSSLLPDPQKLDLSRVPDHEYLPKAFLVFVFNKDWLLTMRLCGTWVSDLRLCSIYGHRLRQLHHSMEPPETGGSVGRCAGSTTRLEDEEEPALAFSMSSRLEKQIYLRYVLAHARTPTITIILSSDKKKKKKN